MNSPRMALIAAFLFLTPCVLSHAQWTSDPAANTPICRAGNNQKAPRAIGDGKGGAIVCWADERVAANFTTIYAQRIDKDGFVRWTVNGIAVSGAIDGQTKPEMVSDDAGGAIIVWTDTRNGDLDVYAQRIDSSGNVLWKAEGVPVATGGLLQTDAKLVGDGQHGAFVTYTGQSSASQDGHVFAQRINANGNAVWSPELTLSFSDQFEAMPCITGDGSGGAYIAWVFYNNAAYDVYMQRVHPSGALQWQSGGVGIATESGAQDSPSLVPDGTGKVFLSYYDWNSGAVPTLHVDIVNPDASTAASFHVTSTSGGQTNPTLVNIGTGLLGIAWEDGRVSRETRAYAQIFDNTGKKSWAADGVELSSRTGSQVTPFIIPDGSGGVIVAWEDLTAGITESDVCAQRVSAAGALLWTGAGVEIGTAAKMQSFPHAVSDGAAGAVVVWEDYRLSFSNPDIYGTRILADGTFPLEPPILTFSSKSVAFGTVSVGFSSTKTITLGNTGDLPVTITSISSNDLHFSLSPENNTIPPNGSVTAELLFQPTSTDALTASLVVESNSAFSPDTVVATGRGSANPEIEVDRRSLNFGDVITGTTASRVLTITNTGNDTLTISSITSSDPAFTSSVASLLLLPGVSFADTVHFAPTATGPYTADLTLTSNAPTSPTMVALSGNGTVRAVTLTIDHTYLYFGECTVGYMKDTTLTVTNSGNDTLRITSLISGDPHFTVETPVGAIAPAGSLTFTIRFAPTAAGSVSTFLVMTSNAVTSPDTIGVQGMGLDVSSVRAPQVFPGAFTLHGNYPNPFRPSTTIRYDLETTAPVRLTVRNALGQVAAILVDETQHPGMHTVRWTPANPVPGVYFLTLRVGAREAFERMVLVR